MKTRKSTLFGIVVCIAVAVITHFTVKTAFSTPKSGCSSCMVGSAISSDLCKMSATADGVRWNAKADIVTADWVASCGQGNGADCAGSVRVTLWESYKGSWLITYSGCFDYYASCGHSGWEVYTTLDRVAELYGSGTYKVTFRFVDEPCGVQNANLLASQNIIFTVN